MTRGMYGLYWEPPVELAYAGPSISLPAALPRFMALSAAWHCLTVLLFVWVGFPLGLTAQQEALVIRDVDFVESLRPLREASPPKRIEAGGGGGRTRSPEVSKAAPKAMAKAGPAGPPVTKASEPVGPPPAPVGPKIVESPSPPASPVAGLEIPAPKTIGSPALRNAAPAPAPARIEASAPSRENQDTVPRSANEVARIIEGDGPRVLAPGPVPLPGSVAAGPRAIGPSTPSVGDAGGSRGPTKVEVARPSGGDGAGTASAGSQLVASARSVTAGGGGTGLVAPVIIPEKFMRGGGGSGTGMGTGTGSGIGSGSGSGSGSGAGPGSGPGRGPGIASINTSDPDFGQYFQALKDRVYAAWRYPKGVAGTHKLSLSFSLKRDGAVQVVRVVNSTNAALDESALAAMERASPFPPIPEKFKQLAGEPLTMIFTVTVK